MTCPAEANLGVKVLSRQGPSLLVSPLQVPLLCPSILCHATYLCESVCLWRTVVCVAEIWIHVSVAHLLLRRRLLIPMCLSHVTCMSWRTCSHKHPFHMHELVSLCFCVSVANRRLRRGILRHVSVAHRLLRRRLLILIGCMMINAWS